MTQRIKPPVPIDILKRLQSYTCGQHVWQGPLRVRGCEPPTCPLCGEPAVDETE